MPTPIAIDGVEVSSRNPLPLTLGTPPGFYHGRKTVTTATTRVVLAADQPLLNGVTIKAAAANTGLIYVGGPTVAAANGFELAAGESHFFDAANLADVYLDASVNTQAVVYCAS